MIYKLCFYVEEVNYSTIREEHCMTREERNLETIPVGPLGIICLPSCKALGDKINSYIVDWRLKRENEHTATLPFNGYLKDSYLVNVKVPRFGSGEGKGIINQSVRGDDLYILTDVTNYSLTYSLCGVTDRKSVV